MVFGTIAGFAIFAIMFIITIIMIFHDIKKRYDEYVILVEEDKVMIKELEKHFPDNERIKSERIRAEELARRLAGTKPEDKGDDQLLGEAVKLTASQW